MRTTFIGVAFGVVLGIATVGGSEDRAHADHNDGNIPQSVSYWAVDGFMRVCDSSLMAHSGITNTMVAVWNENAGPGQDQQTVSQTSCSNPGVTVVDENAGYCPVDPGKDTVGCAAKPTDDVQQHRFIHLERDADWVDQGSPVVTPILGEYFDNTTLSGSPVYTRTDPEIYFDWGAGSPAPGVPADWFSVRWTWSPNFQLNGVYSFTTFTDDGVRLWVDNQLILDAWTGGPGERTATRTMTAGHHAIRMEYNEGPGNAIAKFQVAFDNYTGAVAAHEMGHTLGFDHYFEDGCQLYLGSLMASQTCPSDVAQAQLTEEQNWMYGYHPDAPSPSINPDTFTGCVGPYWNPSNNHNEKQFDTWHFDGPGGSAVYVGSTPKNVGGGYTWCDQMPGTRTYWIYPVSDAWYYYFGDSFGVTVTVPGSLPGITSLSANAPNQIAVYWQNSNPAGAEVHVEASTAGSNGPWTEVGTDVTSPFTHGGLAAGTPYWYRIRSHSHGSGGLSGYSGVVSAYTQPNTPSSLGGVFYLSNNVNRVRVCISPVAGASSYVLFRYRGGAQSATLTTIAPNTACYGSVMYDTPSLSADSYHFAVKACASTSCSSYRDMTGAYWWWIPCSTSSGCPAGGTADPGGHSH